MKVMMLLQYYPAYLDYFHERNSFAEEVPFKEQRESLLDDHFGWPGELSRLMDRKGIDTEFLIVNDETLQKKWAKENRFTGYTDKGWEKEIVMEQIKRNKPNLLWLVSMFDYYGEFIRNALKYCKKVVVWIACPLPKGLDISGISTLITAPAARYVLKDLCESFKDVYTTHPGFDAQIIKRLGVVKKEYDLTFVGGLSQHHKKRVETLSYLIDNGIDLSVFGDIRGQRAPGKPKEKESILGRLFTSNKEKKSGYEREIENIMPRHKGPVFGLDMYRVLAASRLTLNIHIDLAGETSGNMRMFEATGAGTCLLTEKTADLGDIFEPDREVLTYSSKEELLDVIQSTLNDRAKREEVAAAGQKRTLSDYTFEKMFNNIRPAFEL